MTTTVIDAWNRENPPGTRVVVTKDVLHDPARFGIVDGEPTQLGSFEHVVANILLLIALLFLPISKGSMLWWMLVVALLILLAVQGFWVWRYTCRQNLVYRARMRRAMELAQAEMNCRWTLEGDDG